MYLWFNFFFPTQGRCGAYVQKEEIFNLETTPMSIYEITFITKEDKPESINKTIGEMGGKIDLTKSLGRKKFTYPIKHETAGFYCTVLFELEGNKLSELDKELRMNQDVLRYITISYQKEFSPREIEKKFNELKGPRQQKEVKKEVTEKATPIQKSIEKPISAVTESQVGDRNKKEIKEVKSVEKIEVETVEEKETAEKVEKTLETNKSVVEEKEKSPAYDKSEPQSESIDKEPVTEKEILAQKPKVVIPEPKKEAVSEEERLAKLEKKLDELLRD